MASGRRRRGPTEPLNMGRTEAQVYRQPAIRLKNNSLAGRHHHHHRFRYTENVKLEQWNKTITILHKTLGGDDEGRRAGLSYTTFDTSGRQREEGRERDRPTFGTEDLSSHTPHHQCSTKPTKNKTANRPQSSSDPRHVVSLATSPSDGQKHIANSSHSFRPLPGTGFGNCHPHGPITTSRSSPNEPSINQSRKRHQHTQYRTGTLIRRRINYLFSKPRNNTPPLHPRTPDQTAPSSYPTS